MANVITAGNSSNGGTAITTDTSGTLNIVTGSGSGATAITVDGSQNVAVNGNMSFNSGYGSAAVAYGCRAWVNFNGTGTVAIRASGNVTSITDNGTGDYTVNFTTAMPDANYSMSGAGRYQDDTPSISFHTSVAPTSSACRIYASRDNGDNQGGVLSDMDYITIALHR